MINQEQKVNRVLGIAPTSRGLGYAVLDGPDRLADWGLKIPAADRDSRLAHHIEKLINVYAPDALVLLEFWKANQKVSKRTQALGACLLKIARSRHVKTVIMSRPRLNRLLLGRSKAGKYEAAQF